MTTTKIELDCYAVVRRTGREVQVTAKYIERGRPVLWGCDDGHEYLASELRRCSKAVYEQLEAERLASEDHDE